MNTNKLVGILLVVALLLGGYGAFKKSQIVYQTQGGQEIQAGSVTGPDVYSPYFAVNGVTSWFVKQAMKQATTSVCQIITPAVRTVLVPFSLSAEFAVSSSTATNVVIATSSSASTATTTLISQMKFPANGTGAVIATTSTLSLVDQVFAASTVINVSMTGGIGTMSPTGSCQATFRQLQ